MEFLLPSFLMAFLGVIMLLNVITLPANWMMIGVLGLWYALMPQPGDMGVMFFAILVGLAGLGELIEFLAQGWGSKKYGSTSGGMWGGLAGALIGAVVGMPFFFGLGSLIGALVGAWCGCYVVEYSRGRSDIDARRAAKGALVGRFLGIVIKCGIGAVMLGLTWQALFASSTSSLPTYTF